MKLVKFNDGTFGVRSGNFFFGYAYADLVTSNLWWPLESAWISDCKGSESAARKRLERYTDKGTPV